MSYFSPYSGLKASSLNRHLLVPLVIVLSFATLTPSVRAEDAAATPPYPPSTVFAGMTWHWDTLRTAAPGSDLWPVTWAGDDNLYAAWGDGGGFGGTDHDGRVALGFARVEGPPEQFVGHNANGGKDPEHPAAFPQKGKVGGLLAVGDKLYGWLNTQSGPWPDVDKALIWSDDRGATWQKSDWVFPHGAGNMKPSTFINFGRGNAPVPAALQGYVYFYAHRQGNDNDTFLGRAPTEKLEDKLAFEFVSNLEDNRTTWSADLEKAVPIFTDRNPCGNLSGGVYLPKLKRFLSTTFHSGPGQLGVFEAPHPWGPWRTVAYYENWGGMGTAGEGLTCSFPLKWTSDDNLTLWCVFSVYGAGGKEGINAHDRFNLVKATLETK
jgi:Domain of unknown function (DUF4185)